MSDDNLKSREVESLAHEELGIWLFGYGSLIFKVDFPYLERKPASIQKWARRFWQGSHDHRGSVEKPGRVVTLIAEENARCGGMAYRVKPEVFAQLDIREQNGYARFTTEMTFNDGSSAPGLVYIATQDNIAYLGEASEYEIARHIAGSSGPSGSNNEYLIELARALRALGEDDAHVYEIEQYLLKMIP